MNKLLGLDRVRTATLVIAVLVTLGSRNALGQWPTQVAKITGVHVTKESGKAVISLVSTSEVQYKLLKSSTPNELAVQVFPASLAGRTQTDPSLHDIVRSVIVSNDQSSPNAVDIVITCVQPNPKYVIVRNRAGNGLTLSIVNYSLNTPVVVTHPSRSPVSEPVSQSHIPYTMPDVCTVTIVMTLSDGTKVTQHYYTNGGNERVDSDFGDETLILRDKKVKYTINVPRKTYMEESIGPGLAKNFATADYTFSKVGTETVNGHVCDKWHKTIFGSDHGYVWVDQKTKYPVQDAGTDGSISTFDLKVGTPPASVFDLPAGFKKSSTL